VSDRYIIRTTGQTGPVDTTAQTQLAAHLADTSDAHDASAISFSATGNIAATDVQAAIAELDSEKATTGSVSTVASDLAAHIGDTADAHDASAVSVLDTAGYYAATDVEAMALEQVDMFAPDRNSLAKARAALRPYQAARARVKGGIGTCDVLVIGTSLSESGSNGTVTASISYVNRWQNVWRDMERAKLGQTNGGVTFLPADWGTTAVTPTPYSSEAGTWANKRQNFGLGCRTAEATTTASKTYTQTCTGFDIFYSGWSSGGTMYYKIDGGSAVTFSTTNATLASGKVRSVTGLSDAEHTIEVGWSSGSNIYFEGVAFYRGDETVGFRVWDGARSSASTTNFAESLAPNWWPVVATIQPDLVVIELGINEVLVSVSAATYKSRIEAMIASIRSRTTVDPPIVLMSVWASGAQSNGVYAPFATAMREIAASDANVLYFDGNSRTYPTEAESLANANGLLESDHLHANQSGSALLALAFYEFLGAVA